MATVQCLSLHQFDASYISKLESRDSGVEAHFAVYFSRFMTGSLRRRAASAERINDIRQETFARVLAAVHSDQGIRRPECFGAFVASVCRNVLYESYRGDRFESMEDVPPQIAGLNYSPDAQYAAAESQQQVRRVLRLMDGEEEQLLRAVYLEERDRDELCRELGISRGYLRVLLHRAKQQFRERFKKQISAKPAGRKPESRPAQASSAKVRSITTGKPASAGVAVRTQARRVPIALVRPMVVLPREASFVTAAQA
jgi:RNA polymerase sigma-70 factor (ECF subfamily)